MFAVWFVFIPNAFSYFPCLHESCSLFVRSNRLILATVGGFSAHIQVIVFWCHWNQGLKRCCVTVKSLARLLQIGQLGTVRQRWLQLPLKHLPHVSKTAPLPLSLAETHLNISLSLSFSVPSRVFLALFAPPSLTLSFSVFQDIKLSADSYRIYSLYHSLHHYKYHTFLQCKKEVSKHIFPCFKRLVLFRAVSVLCDKTGRFFDCLFLF